MEEIKFACSSCSCCCKRVGQAIKNLQELGFPYKAKKDGSCEQLSEDGKCNVYDSRPDVCNISKMYEKLHKHSGKSKKEVYLSEAKLCNQFQKEDRIGKEFRINLKQYQ